MQTHTHKTHAHDFKREARDSSSARGSLAWAYDMPCMPPGGQCVAVCNSVLQQSVAECCSVLHTQLRPSMSWGHSAHAPKKVGVQAALHDNRAWGCKEHVRRHRVFDGRLRAVPCDPCRTRQPSLSRCFSNTAVLAEMERLRHREGGGTWSEIALYPPAFLNERGIDTRVNGRHSNRAVGAPLLSHGGLSVSRMPHQSFHPRRVRFLCIIHRQTHAHAHARTPTPTPTLPHTRSPLPSQHRQLK